MPTYHAPFAALVESWDQPALLAVRRRLAALEPSLRSLTGPAPTLHRSADAEQLLTALTRSGPDGHLVALVLLAPALDRVSSALARTWRVDTEEVAADIAAEAWSRIQHPQPLGRAWAHIVGGARLSTRHRLATTARHTRRRTELTDVVADDPDPADAAAGLDTWTRWRTRVGPDDLLVIAATRHGGWTVRSWAAHHDLHPARVYSARRRAEALLREAS